MDCISYFPGRDPFPATDTDSVFSIANKERYVWSGDDDGRAAHRVNRDITVKHRRVDRPCRITVDDDVPGPVRNRFHGIATGCFRRGRDNRTEANSRELPGQIICTVMPSDNRDYIDHIRADDHHRRIIPFVPEERGNLPYNDPHRHEGNDTIHLRKYRPEDLRMVFNDVSAEMAGETFRIRKKAVECNDHGAGHE